MKKQWGVEPSELPAAILRRLPVRFTYDDNYEQTVCFREYSSATGPGDVPYYPMRLAADMELLAQYRAKAENEPGLTFIGRLGTYRYLDMHVVIRESLELAALCLKTPQADWPSFSGEPPAEN